MDTHMGQEAEQTETRRPGRPKRAEATQTERRRRAGGTMNKLAIPNEVKTRHPDMEFRWARDDGGRMQQLTVNDDWDAVPGVEPIHGGKSDSGTAMKMHLLMKPKSFMEQDMAEKLERIDAQVQGRMVAPEKATALATGSEYYSVPGNKLS